MAAELGEPVSFGDHTVHAFPAPPRLANLDDGFPGLLAGRKPKWLRALARAALNGRLDTAQPRSQPYEEALAGFDHPSRHRAIRGRADPAARRRGARPYPHPRNPAGSRGRPGLSPPRAPISH